MPVAPRSPLSVLVVAHTHWDREWYHPAGRFRQRLVALIDELLDDAATSHAPFLLDGQAIVLEDYLEVRPERRELLAARLRNGTLEAGPWYVLADELIPSGEALVRNLLVGRETLRALGAEPPPVLYSPDAFGHPAALPELAAGFGFTLIVLWRGLGGPHWPAGDAMRWRAASGAEALVYHLPPAGYEFGSSLPVSDEAAAARWARVRDVLAPRATLGLSLLPNGADHHARQPALDEALRALARAAAPAKVRRASLREFATALTERAEHAPLPSIAGELRDSYGYTWTLQGTFGARAALKRRNARVERLLRREAEPWSALAARRTGRSRASLVRAAWRTLLRCHPHDTLCGCSIDAVARAMEARLDDAATQARGLHADALHDLLGHDPAAARERGGGWEPVVIVQNPAARPRGGVAELELATFRQHVPVGPGSGSAPIERHAAPELSLEDGCVPLQLLARTVRHDRVESPVHYPDNDLVDAARVIAWVDPVAGYGSRALAIGTRERTSAAPERVSGGAHWMENAHLRVEVDAHSGAIRLRAPESEFDVARLIAFEDVGDVGDLYTFSPVGGAERAATIEGLEVVHGGPLRAELCVRWRLEIPRRSTRTARSSRRVTIPIRTSLVLDAGASFLRVHVRGVNHARDHRLRVLFTTGVEQAALFADAAFGPVRREPILAPAESAESPPATAPLHRYVTLAGERRGATLYSDGLAEYEAMSNGEIAVTLVRAVGELSRNDLPERPGHAGWPTPTPGAQSLGPFAARFAIFPHGSRTDATVGRIERVADDVLLPLRGVTLRAALARPQPTRGVELEGDGLALSAIKESEDGAWTVLRCVNLLEREQRGRWRLGFPAREARVARLDETPQAPLAIEDGSIAFVAPPRGVVTVLVR